MENNIKRCFKKSKYKGGAKIILRACTFNFFMVFSKSIVHFVPIRPKERELGHHVTIVLCRQPNVRARTPKFAKIASRNWTNTFVKSIFNGNPKYSLIMFSNYNM